MGTELLARVRWNNVGIVALAAGLLVLVIAWPALSPPAPELPRDEPRARVAEAPPSPRTPRARPRPRPAAPPVRDARPRRRASRPRRLVRAVAVPSPVVTAPAGAAPPRVHAAPGPAPEFGFER